ncbi:MAG: DNA alkylation repair protein [Chlamydiota bacterium]
MITLLRQAIQTLGNPTKAKKLQCFFKTGKGEYAEGDVFLGIIVPQQRKLSKEFVDLSYVDLQSLLDSKIHEERLIALLILVRKYELYQESQDGVFQFYLANTKRINNWDLVDLSAPKIPGPYLLEKNKDILYSLARSSNIWERRIAIVSTWWFIKKGLLIDTLKISEILLRDTHDLIHKAVGWMLREVGKKDEKLLDAFLNKHYQAMPRTMLRYAIERMEEMKRKEYLSRPK